MAQEVADPEAIFEDGLIQVSGFSVRDRGDLQAYFHLKNDKYICIKNIYSAENIASHNYSNTLQIQVATHLTEVEKKTKRLYIIWCVLWGTQEKRDQDIL